MIAEAYSWIIIIRNNYAAERSPLHSTPGPPDAGAHERDLLRKNRKQTIRARIGPQVGQGSTRPLARRSLSLATCFRYTNVRCEHANYRISLQSAVHHAAMCAPTYHIASYITIYCKSLASNNEYHSVFRNCSGERF